MQMFSRPVTNRINGDNLSQRHRVAWVSLRVSVSVAVLMYVILRVFQRELKYGILYHMSKLFSFQAILAFFLKRIHKTTPKHLYTWLLKGHKAENILGTSPMADGETEAARG